MMEDSFTNIPHLHLFVDENKLIEGALKILELIRPTWTKENVQFKRGKCGYLYEGARQGLDFNDEFRKFLDHFSKLVHFWHIFKGNHKNILILNVAGLAPRLYATFQNGLAYKFIPGNTLTSKTVSQPEIYKLVAEQMARMHQIQIQDQPYQPMIWKKLQSFLDLIPEPFTDSYKQKRFEDLIMPKQKIREEISFLKERLLKLNSPIVFGHNDLLLANVIYTPQKNKVSFIDFEYSALNHQAFDIGNHFAEFAGVGEVDYSRYPSKELQWNWLRIYLSTLRGEDDIPERDIQKLYVQVNQFALLSHVFWGVWALIQAQHSFIDFDFMGYSAIRFNEYLAKKDVFLSLDLSR